MEKKNKGLIIFFKFKCFFLSVLIIVITIISILKINDLFS